MSGQSLPLVLRLRRHEKVLREGIFWHVHHDTLQVRVNTVICLTIPLSSVPREYKRIIVQVEINSEERHPKASVTRARDSDPAAHLAFRATRKCSC